MATVSEDMVQASSHNDKSEGIERINMKKRITRSWIPFWGDKWLFGSMRQEFSAAERGIWWDLMAMAMKDDGYIRANEDFAYPIEQLAGFFLVPKDELQKAIDKFVEAEKLTRNEKGILYITNWKKYCFTDRHMRRLGMELEDDEMSAETDTIAETEDTEGEVADTRKEKNRIEKKREEEKREEYSPEFESFWKNYPKKKEKKDAYFTWKTLTKKQQEEATIAAKHYKMETDALQTEEEYIKNPKTFLNKKKEKWKDYMEPPKIKKRLTAQEAEDEKIKDWAKQED